MAPRGRRAGCFQYPTAAIYMWALPIICVLPRLVLRRFWLAPGCYCGLGGCRGLRFRAECAGGVVEPGVAGKERH